MGLKVQSGKGWKRRRFIDIKVGGIEFELPPALAGGFKKSLVKGFSQIFMLLNFKKKSAETMYIISADFYIESIFL